MDQTAEDARLIAEFKRRGHESVLREYLSYSDRKRVLAEQWLADEAANRCIREAKLFSYAKWTFWAAIAAVAVGVVGIVVTIWH